MSWTQWGGSISGRLMVPNTVGGRRSRSYRELRQTVRLLHDQARAESAFGEARKAALHRSAAVQFAREARRLWHELRNNGSLRTV